MLHTGKHRRPVEINIGWIGRHGSKAFNTSCKSLTNGNELGEIELVREEVVVFLYNEGKKPAISDKI